jgi:hypothetical protein
MGITDDSGGFAANEDGCDAWAGNGSPMIGNIAESCCGWHNLLLSVDLY